MLTRLAIAACVFCFSVSLSGGTSFIPISADAQGANDTRFQTDVRLIPFGFGGTPIFDGPPIMVTAEFLPANRDNSVPSPRTIMIQPGEMLVVNNIVGDFFQTSGLGSIRFQSDVALHITSRTYTDSPNPAAPGTFGQFIPAFDENSAMTSGVLPHLSNDTNLSQGFRANVGFMNPGDSPVTVGVTGRSINGTPLGSGTVGPIPPRSVTQVSVGAAIGNNVSFSDGSLTFESPTPVFGFASVVDNRSADQFFIPAQSPSVQGPVSRIVPISAVAPGANDTLFRTDVRVIPSGSDGPPIIITAEFLPAGTDNSVPDTRTITIPPGEMLVLNNIVGDFFGESGLGAIRFESDSNFFITSRTYTDSPNPAAPGTFGQFIPAFDEGNAMQSGVLLQLSNEMDLSQGFRTNLGFMNPGDVPVTVDVAARSPDGAQLGMGSVGPISPRSVNQLSLDAAIAAQLLAGDLYVTVDATGPVFGYASVVDNRSSDQFFIPARIPPFDFGEFCGGQIPPGSYRGVGGNCGVSGEVTISCLPRFTEGYTLTNPNLNLTCDATGDCGDDNTVFGVAGHKCDIESDLARLFPILRVICQRPGAQCTQDFELSPP